MKYDIELNEHNVQVYQDMYLDMQKKKTGNFSFIIKIHNGCIVDYAIIDYEQYKEYKSILRSTRNQGPRV